MACRGVGVRHRPQVFVLSRWADSRVRGGGDRKMAGPSLSQSVFPRQFWERRLWVTEHQGGEEAGPDGSVGVLSTWLCSAFPPMLIPPPPRILCPD